MPPVDGDTESKINTILDRDLGPEPQDEGSTKGTESSGEGGGTSLVPASGKQQQPATRADTDDQSQPQHDQQGKPAQPTELPGRTRPTDNGDLIDPNTGRVIARAGRERRVYETERAVSKATAPLQTELTRTRAELDAFRQAASLPTQLGLGPQEVSTAMQFMSHWKRDPVGAAQNMLTELRTAGYDVPGLGGTVDVAAIQRMIRQEIAPFQQDRESQRQHAESYTSAQQEVADLYADMPWARMQEQELTSILQADNALSLRDAAYQLQIWAIQRGYDINQPLRPQHQSALQRAQAGNGNGQQQQNVARAPGPVNGGDGTLRPRQGSSVGHDRSTRDIVREAMREAGINAG